jgi:hypothetical protein
VHEHGDGKNKDLVLILRAVMGRAVKVRKHSCFGAENGCIHFSSHHNHHWHRHQQQQQAITSPAACTLV